MPPQEAFSQLKFTKMCFRQTTLDTWESLKHFHGPIVGTPTVHSPFNILILGTFELQHSTPTNYYMSAAVVDSGTLSLPFHTLLIIAAAMLNEMCH